MAFFTDGKFVQLDEWRETLPAGESKYPEYRDYDPTDAWKHLEHPGECLDTLDKVNGVIDWYLEEDITLAEDEAYVPAFSGRTGNGMRRMIISQTKEGRGEFLRLHSRKYSNQGWKAHRRNQYRLSFPQ